MALEIKTEVKELSPVERELTVVVAGGAVAKELDKAYKSLAKKVRLKGFRAGKVPRYVLEQYYKDDTERSVLEKLLNDSFRQAVKSEGLSPVSDPEIQAVPELIQGVDYTYQAKVEVKPEFNLEKYEGLELTRKIYVVDDAAVDKQLQSMRERQTQVVPVEDRDIVQQGDLVEVNFSGAIGGEPVKGLGGVSYVIEVGAGRFYKEAEQALVGKKIGESFDVDVQVPEDHRVEAARGQTATLTIKPLELKQKKMPELNDEFAQDVDDKFETLDDLKKAIRESFEEQAKARTENEIRDAALDALIEANPFEVPGSLVTRQAQQMAVDQLTRLPQESAERIWAAQGQKLTEEARPRALKSVRGGLLLEKLVDTLGIEVSDEDVDKKIEELAVQMNQGAKNLKKLYKRQGMLDSLRHQIASDRALDRVVESATVKEEQVSMADEV